MKLKKIKKLLKNTYFLAIARALGSIALITAVAALSVHYLTGPTLSEYKNENPSIQSDKTDDSNVDRTVESLDENANSTFTDSTNDNNEEAGENNTIPENIDTVIAEESDSEDASILAGGVQSSINIGNMVHFYSYESDSLDRVTVSDGFYYEPLSDSVIEYITGTSFPSDQTNVQITYDELYYIGLLYVDFNGLTQAGELICNKAIAEDLVEIFHELYLADYQLEKIVLVDNYGGDDTASMCANNTSCFNYRVVDDSTSLSNHAYGRAIDINPFYNPYIIFGGNEDGSDYISPSGSEAYADRAKSFAYKIDENDLCYKLFIEHGFTWGGNWNSCKDYQHFQKKN